MTGDQEKITPKPRVSDVRRLPADVRCGSSRRRLVVRREHRSPLLATSARLFAPLLIVLTVGACGEGSDEPETVSQEPSPTATAPSDPPRPDGADSKAPGGVADAIAARDSLEAQGERAGAAGFSVHQLLPSEEGAARLVKGGYVDEEQICAAMDAVMDAEGDPKVAAQLDEAGLPLGYDEEAFSSGWSGTALAGTADLGAGIYNAFFTRCVLE